MKKIFMFSQNNTKIHRITEDTELTAKKIYTHASKGAPSKLLVYRMATTSAKVASCSLDGGMKLETLYPTTRKFSVIVKDGVAEGSKAKILGEEAESIQTFLQS